MIIDRQKKVTASRTKSSNDCIVAGYARVIDLWPRKDIRSRVRCVLMRPCYSTEPDDSRARPNSIHSEFKLSLESLAPLSSRISALPVFHVFLSLSLSFPSIPPVNFITVRVSAEMYPRPRRCTYARIILARFPTHPCACLHRSQCAPFTGARVTDRVRSREEYLEEQVRQREDKSMLERVSCMRGWFWMDCCGSLTNGVNWNLF